MARPEPVTSISPRNGRRELIAACQHAGQRHDIALLDINIDADPALSQLIAAYRRWLALVPNTSLPDSVSTWVCQT